MKRPKSIIKSLFTNVIGKSSIQRINSDYFRHPVLSQSEKQIGTRLVFDTWADTSCAGKHLYVESFLNGKVINAGGFVPSLGTIKGLPIVNVLYADDLQDGSTVILENCRAIYLGDKMNDSLINPLQAEESGV